MNLNNSIINWLLLCPAIENVFFAFSQSDIDGTSVVPISSDEWLTRYLDGTGEKLYTMSLIQYKDLSNTPNSSTNAETQHSIEGIMDWINEQNKIKNFPDFGSNRIEEITVLENVPELSEIDNNRAKYIFSVQIKYYKE